MLLQPRTLVVVDFDMSLVDVNRYAVAKVSHCPCVANPTLRKRLVVAR